MPPKRKEAELEFKVEKDCLEMKWRSNLKG